MGRKLKIEEVCELLGITRATWAQMVYRGEAPPRIVISQRRHLVDEESLEAWLQSREERQRA